MRRSQARNHPRDGFVWPAGVDASDLVLDAARNKGKRSLKISRYILTLDLHPITFKIEIYRIRDPLSPTHSRHPKQKVGIDMEQWLINSPTTIDLEVVRHVRANLMQGSIDIIAHDEPTCRVEVSAVEGSELRVALEGDVLLINHPQLRWNELGSSARALFENPKVRVSVLVPAQVEVNVKATSANVLTVGVHGNVTITTLGGEHFCDNTAGKLTLTSATGELSVRGHSGSVDTRTASGDVTVTGPITEFSGNTISGSTVVDVAGSVPTRISNISVSGATTVRLPADVTPFAEVTAVTGRAQLGSTVLEPLRGRTERVGDAETATTKLRLSTATGRLVVLREGGNWPDAASAAGAAEASAGAGAGAGAAVGGDAAGSDAAAGDDAAAAYRVTDAVNVDLSSAPKPTRIHNTESEAAPAAAAGETEATEAENEPRASGHQPFEPGQTQTAGGNE